MKLGAHERQPDTGWHIETEADRQAVQEQLERLLASPAFRGSKRLSGFLRYIVEQTIENGGAELKERTVGVQVFGRAPDYDTSVEPVVRVSAGDLRKRIAQYYHEAGHENELRIDLPTGSYHPVFHMAASTPAALTVAPATVPEIKPIPGSARLAENSLRREPSRQWMSPRVLYGAITALAVALAAFALIATRPGNAYEQFWNPVVSEPGSMLIYLGHTPPDGHIVTDDAIALTDLIGNLRAMGKPYRILESADMTPELMKQGPSLMIGGYTNPVTQRLTAQARFTFVREGDQGNGNATHYILDKQNPSSRAWIADPIAGPTPTFTDYAIVSRILDPATGRLAVVSAGIHRFGTLAAADFLSNPEKLAMLTAHAPRDWRKEDMQAVLAMDVKDGRPTGPIRVLASYFW
jgi:hypothetical protein